LGCNLLSPASLRLEEEGARADRRAVAERDAEIGRAVDDNASQTETAALVGMPPEAYQAVRRTGR
jgi:hypothetical protein